MNESSFEYKEAVPEIPTKVLSEIKQEVLNNPLDWNDIEVDNIVYALRTCESINSRGETNGQPVEYHEQSGEWAIYIWDDLLEKVQRVLLFHEMVEIYFREKFGLEKTPAHNATLGYEEWFKKEISLTPQEESSLRDLREKYRNGTI